MKKMRLGFSEKGELQHQRNSLLIAFIGIASTWGSQNDIFCEVKLIFS